MDDRTALANWSIELNEPFTDYLLSTDDYKIAVTFVADFLESVIIRYSHYYESYRLMSVTDSTTKHKNRKDIIKTMPRSGCAISRDGVWYSPQNLYRWMGRDNASETVDLHLIYWELSYGGLL